MKTTSTSKKKTTIKKVVLAYSGGLDTSVILKWLQDEYDCEVITFTADIGQGEELAPAKKKAEKFGIKKIYIDDLREEFVRDFVFPMFRANTVYEGEYLLGTSIARPLIAKRMIEIAKKEKADAISHGATGKGNDQVRFELGAYALMPNIKVIAPWREWNLLSRDKLLAYADQHGIPVDYKKRKGEAPFSMDANLLHISYEGGVLEDPNREPPAEGMWRLTAPLEKTPNKPEVVELEFSKGDLCAINGKTMKAHELLIKLNALGVSPEDIWCYCQKPICGVLICHGTDMLINPEDLLNDDEPRSVAGWWVADIGIKLTAIGACYGNPFTIHR